MTQENKLLRYLFPEPFWECKPLAFDFISEFPRLKDLLESYLDGEKIKIDSKSMQRQQKMHKAVLGFIESTGGEVISGVEKDDDNTKKMWAKSLLEFFLLGIEKQEKGSQPKVEISW